MGFVLSIWSVLQLKFGTKKYGLVALETLTNIKVDTFKKYALHK